MAHEIFISHSSKDKTIADAIVACLERRGLRCWVAPRDIVAGMDWSASIIDGINGAKVMVLILSENSNVSKQVLREIERAANRGISILPFRVSDVELSKSLEYFLSSAHWLDAYHGKLKDHIDVLSNNVANILDKQDAIVDVKAPDSNSKNQKRLALFVVAAVILFIGLITAFLGWSSHNKKTTIQNALNQGDYEAVLMLDPTNAQAIGMQDKAEELTKAIAIGNFEKALELDPENQIALAQKKKAKVEEAIAAGDFKTALALDPDNKQAIALKKEQIRYSSGIGGTKSYIQLWQKHSGP